MARPKPERGKPKRRQGWIWQAIQAVLRSADEPLKPAAIFARVAERDVNPVSKSSIKGELRRQLGRPNALLQQDEDGRYYLSPF